MAADIKREHRKGALPIDFAAHNDSNWLSYLHYRPVSFVFGHVRIKIEFSSCYVRDTSCAGDLNML